MNDKKCNGWSNYETWNYKLWIDNDEYWQESTREIAQEILNDSEADKTFTAKENAAFKLKDTLKEQCDNNLEEFLQGKTFGPFVDLINASVSEIDFYEIAENILSDLEKETE